MHFAGTRDFWIVKSEDAWIQGRAEGIPGFTKGFAVGGNFMNGHKLTFLNQGLSTSGEAIPAIEFDGQPILTSFPSSFEEIGTLSAHHDMDLQMSPKDQGQLSGMVSNRLKNTKTYRFVFSRGVSIHVVLVDHMTLVVKMWPTFGKQDGYCGNFNGIATDDKVSELIKRGAGWAPKAKLNLFGVKAWDPKVVDCRPNKAVLGKKALVSRSMDKTSDACANFCATISGAIAFDVGRVNKKAKKPCRCIGGGRPKKFKGRTYCMLGRPQGAAAQSFLHGHPEGGTPAIEKCGEGSEVLERARRCCAKIPKRELRHACESDYCITEDCGESTDGSLTAEGADDEAEEDTEQEKEESMSVSTNITCGKELAKAIEDSEKAQAQAQAQR